MDTYDAIVQFAALVGVGLLILAGLLWLVERGKDGRTRFVIRDGRIRRRSTLEREQIAAANERADALRKRLEHPGFIGWQEEWSWLRS